ncbi:MAG: helix-turn-helix domain-containing protein [Rhodanobacteraceae bacterium]
MTVTAASANQLAVVDRSSKWQRSIADCCVRCDISVPPRFRGAISSAQIGALRCNRVKAMRHRATRTALEDRNDAILLNRVIAGTVHVMQDGRDAVLRAGDFAIHDAARPYALAFDTPFAELIFQIPRSVFRRRLGSFDHLTAVAVSGDDPIGRLASNFLLDLVRGADRLEMPVATRLSLQAVDLVADALALPAGERQLRCGASAHRSALLYRVKTFVEAHLDEALAAADVGAAVLGCSARYVHDLFADESVSLGEYVLARRLERCMSDLVCGPSGRRVSEVAYAWGFNSPSHFSRSFRARFGASPSEVRGRGPRTRAPAARRV